MAIGDPWPDIGRYEPPAAAEPDLMRAVRDDLIDIKAIMRNIAARLDRMDRTLGEIRRALDQLRSDG